MESETLNQQWTECIIEILIGAHHKFQIMQAVGNSAGPIPGVCIFNGCPGTWGNHEAALKTWQWYNGTHTEFGSHWVGLEPIPILCFVVTSLIGIWGVTFEWLVYEQRSSILMKLLVPVVLLSGTYYEMVISFTVGNSSVLWHLGHMFITHLTFSMFPVMIVWGYAPEIDLFTIVQHAVKYNQLSRGSGIGTHKCSHVIFICVAEGMWNRDFYFDFDIRCDKYTCPVPLFWGMRAWFRYCTSNDLSHFNLTPLPLVLRTVLLYNCHADYTELSTG